MSQSKYIIQHAHGTKCKDCEGSVDLLCPTVPGRGSKMFYICWKCKTVAQIGVGMIKREENIIERRRFS